ncbi:TPA: hypothetical protein ACGUPG_004535 [Vibrio vulnificus]
MPPIISVRTLFCYHFFQYGVLTVSKTILIKPKFTNDASSYWAMFYCAILKTLVYQQNLKYRFKSNSLQSYRGVLEHPANFLNQMRGNISNHGLEYLMIDFLRSVDGVDVTKELVSNLLRKHGVTDFEYQYLNVFKLGDDSTLHSTIEQYEDPNVKVFTPNKTMPFNRKKIIQGFTYPLSNIARSFVYSDLLIMISDGKGHTYGFVGEVEGQHGENLFRSTYWDNRDGIKSRYTTFAIGASDKKRAVNKVPVKENITLTEDINGRFILHFSNAHHFIKGFKHAIKNVELCLGGHYNNIDGLDDSHRKVLNVVNDGWGSDKYEVIKNLESLIDYDVDIEHFYYENEDAKFKPSAIALTNQFHLHKIGVNR